MRKRRGLGFCLCGGVAAWGFPLLCRRLDRSGAGAARPKVCCLLGFSGSSRAARRRLNIPEGGRVGKRPTGRRTEAGGPVSGWAGLGCAGRTAFPF